MASSSTIYPDQSARLDAYIPAICRIVRIADNRPLGTGFLIAPGVVMTCHHVVPKLAKPGECRAEFYGAPIVDQSNLSTRKVVYFEAIPFDPDESKCITSPQNLGKFVINGKEKLLPIAADAGKLDYSILSLMTNPKLLKVKYFDLFHACTGPMIEQLSSAFVFQHPDIESRDASGLWIKSHDLPSSTNSKKKTKKIWTRGEFNLATGPLRTCGEYEIHYAPETSPGSSGGPVTDAMGNLIALHYQGKIPKCGCQKSTTVLCNAGVRIDQIVDDLRITERRQQVEDLIKQNTLRTNLRITQHIANFYRDQRTVTVLSHGEDWFFPVDAVYTDLLIIGEFGRKEQQDQKKSFEERRVMTHETLYERPKYHVGIGQLFEQKEWKDAPKKRAIIYGVAGAGKTTFSEMLAIHGAELWPDQFKMVFLIKLRNLNQDNYPNLGKDYSIAEILEKEYRISLEDSAAASATEFQCSLNELREFLGHESFKNEVLLILDGFDELPAEADSGKGPLRYVIRDLEKAFNHILITSRPGTVKFRNVEMSCKTEFEITGFDEKSIDRYIKNFFEKLEEKGMIQLGSSALDKTTKLCSILREHPLLHNLVHIPINLTLICSIYNGSEESVDSTDTFSLTDFYLSTVECLFKRFFNRPDVVSSCQQDPDFDPLSTSLFQDLNKALQIIAWKAMENDSIQFTQQTVTEIISKNRKLFQNSECIVGNLKKIGLMKFEPVLRPTKPGMGTWEFIHLTFQEYFAAVFLANIYLEGNVDEAKKLLIKIKFIPSYKLTLYMTAGYLSHMASQNEENLPALQIFFDHLFGQPTDLTKRSLHLFGACFEECKSPREIQPHYSTFIGDCVKYIETADPLSSVFELLKRRTHLLHNDDIVRAIITRLNHPDEKKKMVQMLDKLTSNGQIFPIRFVEPLGIIAQDTNRNEYVGERAADILVKMAKRGTEVTLEVVKTLEKFVGDKELDVLVRERSMKALENLYEEGGDISSEIIHSLMMMLTDHTLNDMIARSIVSTLGVIAKRKKMIIPELMNHLMTRARDQTLKDDLRENTLKAIESLVKEAETISQEVCEALFMMLQDPRLGTFVSFNLVDALTEIAKKNEERIPQTLKDLIDLIRDPDIVGEVRHRAEWLLTRMASVSERMKENLLNTSILILRDQTFHPHVKSSVAETITKMAQRGIAIPLEAVNTLVVMVEDTTLSNEIKSIFVSALGEIAQRGGVTALDALKAIVMKLQESRFHYGLKNQAVSALGDCVRRGRSIPPEALSGLVMMLQDPNLDCKDKERLICVLGDIGQGNDENAQEAMHALVGIVLNSSVEPFIRGEAISIFGKILEAKEEIITEVFDALVTILKDTSLADDIRGQAALALGDVVKRKEAIHPEAWEALVWVIQDPESHGHVITKTIEALKEITTRKTIPQKVIHPLVIVSRDQKFDIDVRIKALEILLKAREVEDTIALEALNELVRLVRDLSVSKEAVEAVYILGEVGQKEGSIAIKAVNELADLVRDTNIDFDVIIIGEQALGDIAKQHGPIASHALDVLFDLSQDLNLGDYFRATAATRLGSLAREGRGIPQMMLNAIIQSSTLHVEGKLEATRALGQIVKKGGTLPQESLDVILVMLQSQKMREDDKKNLIGGIGDIVEQRGKIGLEALHALVMTVCYEDSVEVIEHVLEKISLTTLVNTITDIPSCQLVFLVCLLSSRGFVLFDGNIYINDNRKQKSVRCPEGVHAEVLERMILSTGPSPLNFSHSSSSSSGSVHDNTPEGSTTVPDDDTHNFINAIASIQLENPYHQLDDIFEGVYGKVLMREEELAELLVMLNEQEADSIPKNILVKYLVSKCIEAADEHFAEVEKTFSYISIAGLEKIAGYYSSRKSSWIEESLTKIGCFTPSSSLAPPPTSSLASCVVS